MSKEIRLVVDAVSNEKDISQKVIFEAVEAALESATKKHYGLEKDFRVSINTTSGEYVTFRRWTVIDPENLPEGVEEFNPESHLTLEQAEEKKEGSAIGDVFEESFESIDFGRIAAQAAKQVILQRLRLAKREQVVQEYVHRIGELLTGTVKKVTRDNIIIELPNNAEAVLKRTDLLPREVFRVGDRLRAYLQEVHHEPRGPQLCLSRTAPEMLIALFKIEVPEIGDGQIEIKAAARDPGSRAKIAVQAKDTRLDPIGACVGMRGARVQAVSSELGGERVDIVLWDETPAQFVINAIAPAEVASIIVDEDAQIMDVVVDASQLSQAIGRNGQNVKLAKQLTGWELNVISQEQAKERQMGEEGHLKQLFQDQVGMSEEQAALFVESGFTSLEEIAYVPLQEILEIEGMSEDVVTVFRQRAKDVLSTQALVSEERLGTVEPAADLLELEGMDKALANELAKAGVLTREDLAEQSIDELLAIAGLEEGRAAKLIMAARAHWFVGQE
jgi:N utilization substance protein A